MTPPVPPQRIGEAFRLDGRLALVTGAGSGLGRVFATALAAVGAEVICADLRPERAEETAAALQADGFAAEAAAVDVADEQSVAALAKGLDGRPLRVLVNNAGIATQFARVHESDVGEWDRALAVNLRGTYLCTRALLPAMLGGAGGAIVNVASVAGMTGAPPDIVGQAGISNYVASKAAVVGFTKQLAVEYAADGIRANAIAPGWHGGTRLGQEAGPADPEVGRRMFERIVAVTPMGRPGAAEELAGLVVYLAADASSYVTGEVVVHDGGLMAW
ncbi:MAG TPA: SDR family NAD(P)-dependent oxidoreductase [Solirubrobacterales bacterium]|jgi:NAD(P)-dependent dehydrogenase (short-subunit alcohol dehydrogenase family)